MNDHSEYSLLIFPPQAVEDQLRTWVAPTPGASLPVWGAHVTLLNGFAPVQGLAPILAATAETCARYSPLTVRLDRVAAHLHVARPHLMAVFLVSDPNEDGYRELVSLQNELKRVVTPLKRDVDPKTGAAAFTPHVSLTWGLPKVEAEHLVEAAQRANLAVEFGVDKIWLVAFSPSVSEARTVTRVESFSLSTPRPFHQPLRED